MEITIAAIIQAMACLKKSNNEIPMENAVTHREVPFIGGFRIRYDRNTLGKGAQQSVLKSVALRFLS
jgi:hypothetical protein